MGKNRPGFTCRDLGVDPLGYLSRAFTRLGTHRDIYNLTAAQLTPASYAQAAPTWIRSDSDQAPDRRRRRSMNRPGFSGDPVG